LKLHIKQSNCFKVSNIVVSIYILAKLPFVCLRPSHSLNPERPLGGKIGKYNKKIPLGDATREHFNFTFVPMDSSPSLSLSPFFPLKKHRDGDDSEFTFVVTEKTKVLRL
jgi:hypothetical protein